MYISPALILIQQNSVILTVKQGPRARHKSQCMEGGDALSQPLCVRRQLCHFICIIIFVSSLLNTSAHILSIQKETKQRHTPWSTGSGILMRPVSTSPQHHCYNTGPQGACIYHCPHLADLLHIQKKYLILAIFDHWHMKPYYKAFTS